MQEGRPPPLLLATDSAPMHALAAALAADFSPLPAPDASERFEPWRQEIASGQARARLVVCLWQESATPGPLVDADEHGWNRRFEAPYLLWNVALGAAARACRDGGAIAALVQTPAALDAAGWTPEVSIADGVVALARSLAASEGARGVRVNTVTTPIGLVAPPVIAPAPPLPGFPGALDAQVAGALRLLLSDDASGLTGRVLCADGGRSLA